MGQAHSGTRSRGTVWDAGIGQERGSGCVRTQKLRNTPGCVRWTRSEDWFKSRAKSWGTAWDLPGNNLDLEAKELFGVRQV